MIEKIKKIWMEHEEILNYLVVGGLNTLVSWAAFFLCAYTILDAQVWWQNSILNVIAWIVGVVFGYFMNRKYVFKSTDPHMMKEFLQFSGGRISTGILDNLLMLLLVNVLHIHEGISKVFVSILVIIGNYIISKFFVFKKKPEEE